MSKSYRLLLTVVNMFLKPWNEIEAYSELFVIVTENYFATYFIVRLVQL